MLNPFNGIDATQNERHLGPGRERQPLRRGILVDAVYDIGRIAERSLQPLVGA